MIHAFLSSHPHGLLITGSRHGRIMDVYRVFNGLGSELEAIMYGATVQVMQRWDRGGSLLLSRCTSRPTLAAAMRLLSRIGDGHLYALVGFVLVAASPSWIRTVLPAAGVAFALEVSVQVAVKSLTRRPRPFRAQSPPSLRIAPPGDFSFPSGHAAGAFIMASYLTRLCPPLAIPCYALAALIGISRVANGVHYPSDVVAGAALGLLSASLGAKAFWP